jgi:hypothetical protein
MKEVKDTDLKFGHGLLAKARDIYNRLPSEVRKELPEFPETAVRDQHGIFGYVSETHFFVAKKYPFGDVVSIHKKYWDACAKSNRKLIMYIDSGEHFYEFEPALISDTQENKRGDVEMTNFSIRHGINLVRRIEARIAASKETTSEKCDRLLKGFRPEFGNESHIHLASRVKQLNQLRGHKKQNKKEIERIEKIIISTLENWRKQNEGTSL